MVKKIAIAVVILLVIIAGAAYFLLSNLDTIVKAAIEKYGTAATQATVKLDSVKISLTSGEGTLSGLSVGNPKGFATPQALYLGSINLKLDTSTVTGSGPIVIPEVTIEKPQVTYEVAADGGSNLQTIEKNAMAYAGGNGGASGGGTTSGSAPGRKLIINDLYVRDGQIAISHALLRGKMPSASLPTIHLTNIGKDKGGASPAQIAQQVLGSITASASKVANIDLGKQLGTLKDAVGGGAGSVTDQMKGLLGK